MKGWSVFARRALWNFYAGFFGLGGVALALVWVMTGFEQFMFLVGAYVFIRLGWHAYEASEREQIQ